MVDRLDLDRDMVRSGGLVAVVEEAAVAVGVEEDVTKGEVGGMTGRAETSTIDEVSQIAFVG